jgi:hypothetical protein
MSPRTRGPSVLFGHTILSRRPPGDVFALKAIGIAMAMLRKSSFHLLTCIFDIDFIYSGGGTTFNVVNVKVSQLSVIHHAAMG